MTTNQENEFRRFLEGVIWQGRPLSEKAIAARITKAKQAEEILGMDIEAIIASDEAMRRALIELNPVDTRGNLANAVRKYYEMRRGLVFPPLKEASAVVDDSGVSKPPKSKSATKHPRRHVLVYVCRKGERGLDSFTADGLVVFGEGYGDPGHSGLDEMFGQPGDGLLYDCGEDAPYRYAYYVATDYDQPWIPVEELLKRGCRSIIIDFSRNMPNAFRTSTPRLLREHGYFVVKPLAGSAAR